MELIRLEQNNLILPQFDKPLVGALGQFDGLHNAHLVLIKQAVALAKEKNSYSAVITFDPHPDFILKRQVISTYLTPLDEKTKVLSMLGVDYLIVINFNDSIAKLPHHVFIQQYLVTLGVKQVVVGFDFRYGYRGQGNVTTILSDSNGLITAHVVNEIKYHEDKIGSSLIRQLLDEGKVEQVKEILGRYYEVQGIVVKGNQLGKKIGIPTANIQLREDYAFVKNGVYGVIVDVQGSKHLGICNIGYNPSFNLQSNRRFEVHLLDYDGDLYEQHLRVQFVVRIRDEIKFSSIDAFKNQIKQDIQQVIRLIQI